jgi:predicted ferric reductase
MRKTVFFTLWLALLLMAFLTLIRVTPLSFALGGSVKLTNFIYRGLGLIIFSLLFVQIILGAFMGKLTKKLGEWVFSFHVFEGALAYTLVLLHPIFFLLSTYFAGGKFDPYVAFVNVCLLCNSPAGYYQTLGIISFWLLSVAVFAALFRKSTPWLKANWRKFHVINYVTFLVVGAHGFLLGLDFRVQPFFTFAVLAYAIVLGIVVFIELPRLFKNFRNWVNS